MAAQDIIKQIPNTLEDTELSGLGEKIPGKVRDSYVVGDKRILVTSDRLSAFDVVLTSIPFKGQVLNDMAHYWFKQTEHIIENHIIDRPHPNIFIGKQAEILPVEVVIRGYLTGSAWRDYQAGKDISGIKLPEGLKKSHKFEVPLLTPSTKAEVGEHDQPISSEEILSQGLVKEEIWKEVSEKAMELFKFGTKLAAERGLILVDTKYEFGLISDEEGKKRLILADEVHTSDSSRYWIAESYQQAYQSGEEPKKLDKEFVRGWLIEQGYMGEGTPPEFSDDFRAQVAEKYIEAYETITGESFKAEVRDIKSEVETVGSSLSDKL